MMVRISPRSSLLFFFPFTAWCLAAPTLSAGEMRKSPYFLDGLHCEGLEAVETGEDLTLAYPDEVTAIGRKMRLQELCEATFKDSGVKKFQWVTPEDLERVAFILTRSKKFKSVDIRLEKSELQNHVHLIGRFVLHEPKTYTRIKLQQSLERDQESGDRSSTRAEGTLGFRKRGLINPAPFSLGFKYFSSTAEKALPFERISSDGETIGLDTRETLVQSRPDGSYGAITTKFQQVNGIFFGLDLESSKLSRDKHATLNVKVETGTEFQIDPLSPSLTRLSFFYATYSAKPWDEYTSRVSSRSSRSIAFLGFKQDISSRWVKGTASLYRSLTPELHSFGEVDLALPFGRWFDVQHALGMGAEYIRGAILAEHRYGLPDRNVTRGYYEAERPFVVWDKDHVLSLKIGAGSYQAVNGLEKPYSKDNGFAELSLRSQGESFDTSFAFLYGNRRLY